MMLASAHWLVLLLPLGLLWWWLRPGGWWLRGLRACLAALIRPRIDPSSWLEIQRLPDFEA